MHPQFIRNLDSGMRRLGFLEVLICDCIERDEQLSEKYLGERLWAWADDNQKTILVKLGNKREIGKVEVGKITPKTASRFVKYATEVGFLTAGTEKQLTDNGILFQSYRNETFLIDENPGQVILFLDMLLNKDRLVFTKIIKKIAQSKTLSKKQIFDWFAEKCIEEIIKEVKETEEQDLINRLKETKNSFLSPDKVKERRGYDLIKHILETRIENFVDLGIIEKTPERNYEKNRFTQILNQGINVKSNYRRSLFQSIAKYFKVTKKSTDQQLIKNYIMQYDKLAHEPIDSIYLPTLHTCLFIDGIVNQKILFEDSNIVDLEDLMYKKHYGDVVFLRDRDGKLTHVNIDEKVKAKMRKGKI